MDINNQFLILNQKNLVTFQYLEEGLRMYISNAYEIIKNKLNGTIPFYYTYKDVEKDSLRKLISKFEKFNSNKKLIEKIKKLIPRRNKIAHNSFLFNFKEIDTNELSLKIEKMEKILEEGKSCMTLLRDELLIIEETLSSL